MAKIKKIRFWAAGRALGPQGAPEATNLAKMDPKWPQGSQNAAQETPKSGKMKTKASPELPKCSPEDSENCQNGTLETP